MMVADAVVVVVRARDRARADAGAAVQVPRRPPHPAHAVHQQDRPGDGTRARRAGGAAGGFGAAAGAAPGADPRAATRSPAMSTSSASAPTTTSPGQASDLIPMPEDVLGAREGSAPEPARDARRFRRQAARAAARGRHAVEGGHLRAPDARPAAATASCRCSLGSADRRSRRAPPAEGAAPRGAGREDHVQRLGIDRRGRAAGADLQDLHLPHSGKLSLARVWRGPIADGATLSDGPPARVSPASCRLLGASHVEARQGRSPAIRSRWAAWKV